MKKIRVLIADDHLILRTGLRSIIEMQRDMEVAAEAVNGQEAVDLFCKEEPDVMLLDLRMPLLNGVEVMRAIRERNPEARVIILTTYEGNENIYRALQAGARGYLLKDVPQEELVRAIRLVYGGGYHLPQEIAERLAGRLPLRELSARELEILQGIVKGLSNKEIAAALSITESTVKNHVNNILSKLHVHDRTAAATQALREGIVSLD